jgi:hypothetical protein
VIRAHDPVELPREATRPILLPKRSDASADAEDIGVVVASQKAIEPIRVGHRVVVEKTPRWGRRSCDAFVPSRRAPTNSAILDDA